MSRIFHVLAILPALTGPLAASADGVDPYALTLEDRSAGLVHAVSGGHLAARFVADPRLATLRQTSLSYTPITLEVGMGLSRDFYAWLEAFGSESPYRSGKIAQTDYHYAGTAREFRRAYVSEITFPALDANVDDPTYLTVDLIAEEVREVDAPRLATEPEISEKKWVGSNFSVEIGSLPCGGVTRVDSFSLKQSVSGAVEVANLKITFSAADARAWMDWFERIALEGGGSAASELDGQITWLGPDQQTVLGRIDLLQVGPVSLAVADAEANQDGVALVEVELSVEDAKVRFSRE